MASIRLILLTLYLSFWPSLFRPNIYHYHAVGTMRQQAATYLKKISPV